jgi:hypothetical protein
MSHNIDLTCQCSPSRLLNGVTEQPAKLQLRLRASPGLLAAVPPSPTEVGVDYMLAVDGSGSMGEIVEGKTVPTGKTIQADQQQWNVVTGGRSLLAMCKAALEPLLELLRPGDTLGVLSFSNQPRVLCEKLTAADGERFRAALRRIEPEEDTALGAALNKAAQTLPGPDPTRIRKIILATDCRPTDGKRALGEGRRLAEFGIQLDCLGFGREFDLRRLQDVISFTRGRSEMARNTDEARRQLADFVGRAQDVLATNVKLTFTFSGNVRFGEHYRGAPENHHLGRVRMPDASRELELHHGTLERNQPYTYLFEVTVPPQKDYTGPLRLMKVDVSYDVPALGLKDQHELHNVTVELVGDPEQARARDGVVENEFELVEIKRLEHERDEAMDRRDHASVLLCLEETAARYERLGMLAERDDIETMRQTYVREKKLPQEALNRAARSSSQPIADSSPGADLSEEAARTIFG